jgi:Holliday junction resolvasome RuvABC endonuclease subunit
MVAMNLVGIDLGIHKLALACFTGNTLIDARVVTSDAAQRDVALREITMAAHVLCSAVWDADAIWVESPLVGNNMKYSLALAETNGALLASLAQLRMRGCDIRSVNVSTWKKEVVGKGNASKEQVSNYIVATHPAYAPFCDGDQDLTDAACIGLYGLRISSRAADLHLTSE